MSTSLLLFLALAQPPGLVESKDFSKDAQTAALRATVKVVNQTTNAEGSAVIIKQGKVFVYFLTAAHLARPGDKLEIHTFSAKSYPMAAEVYKSADVLEANKELDLAVLRLTTGDTMPGLLPLCPPKKVLDEKNFPALSVGCGGGKAPVCQAETVRGKKFVRRDKGSKETPLNWETAAAQGKGRSGGPLVDKRGFVIGIASGTSDGHGYYVHSDEINRFLKRNGLEWLYEEEGR